MTDERRHNHSQLEPTVLYWHSNRKEYSLRPPALGDDAATAEATALLEVQRISFTPALSTDFLLPRFPLTATVTVHRLASGQLLGRLELSVVLTDQRELVQEVELIPVEQNDATVVFKACLLPPRPGIFSVSVRLCFAEQTVWLDRQTVRIVEPRVHERWTLGPMLHVVDDGLYLGNVAAATNPEGTDGIGILQSRGITAVLNVAEERDPAPRLLVSGIRYRQIPFKDLSHNPMDADRIVQAVEWIDEQISKKRNVLVHCHAGIGRSGSILVAYIMLFREPRKCFDQVVGAIQSKLRDKGHAIYPHLDLPETIDSLRRRMFHPARGQKSISDPVTRIGSVEFHSLMLGSGARPFAPRRRTIYRVNLGTPIRLRVKVRYEGMPPRGVFVFTNMNRDGPGFEKVPMTQTADDESVFEAVLTPGRAGPAFWLTAFATARKYDHQLTAVWIGQDLHFTVA